MKSIAMVHGYFGMGNVGDEAILSALINEYRHIGFEHMVLSADPRRTQRLHHVYACREKLFSPSFWREFARCSTIVFAGGGRYGAKTFRRMALLAVLAKLLGKDVEYRAVGFYPYHWIGAITLHTKEPIDPLTRYLLRLALGLADRVTVRDEYSKKFIEGYIIGRRVALELDPALRLKPDVHGARRVLEGLGLSIDDIIIGLNIRLLKDPLFIKTLYTVVKALDTYLKENRDVKLLYMPFGYGSTPNRFFDDDIVVGRLIRRYLSRDISNRYYVLEHELRPSTILGLFKFLRAAICVRYHALVFAHMCRTPVFSIAYDTKIPEFLKLMKRLERRVVGTVVKPEDVSVELVLMFLRKYLEV